MDLTKCNYVKSQSKCRGPALAVNSTLRKCLVELRSGFCPQLLNTDKDEGVREKMNQAVCNFIDAIAEFVPKLFKAEKIVEPFDDGTEARYSLNDYGLLVSCLELYFLWSISPFLAPPFRWGVNHQRALKSVAELTDRSLHERENAKPSRKAIDQPSKDQERKQRRLACKLNQYIHLRSSVTTPVSVSSRVSDVWDLLSCAVFNLPLLPHFFPDIIATCLSFQRDDKKMFERLRRIIAIDAHIQINVRALVLLLQTVAAQFQQQRKNSKWSQKSKSSLLKNFKRANQDVGSLLCRVIMTTNGVFTVVEHMLNNYKHLACSAEGSGRSSSQSITAGSRLTHEDDEAYRLAVLICTPPGSVPASVYFSNICKQLVDILRHPRCRAEKAKSSQRVSLDLIVALNCINILLRDQNRRELVIRALLLPALVPFFKCEDEPSGLGAYSLPHCAGLGEDNAGSISLQKEDQVETALRTLEDMLDVILPEQSLLTILAEETVPSLLSLYLFLETAHQNCHLRGAVKRVTLLALRKLSQDLEAILRRLVVQASECSSIEVVDNAFAWRLDQHWAPGPTGGVQLRVDSKLKIDSRVTFARPNHAAIGGDNTAIVFDVVVKLLKALEEPEAVCQLLLDLMTEYFTLRMAADRDPESEEERSWQKFSPRLLLKLLQNEWTVTVFASNVPKSLQCVCTLLNHVVQRISRRNKESPAVDPETASFCVSHCLNILLLLSMLPTTMSVRSNYLELRRALPALEYLNGVSEEARANAEGGCLSDDELQVVTALLRAIYTQTQHADDAESKTSTKDMQNSTSTGDGPGQQDKVISQRDLVLRKTLADMFSEEVLQDLDSDQVPLRAYAVNRIRKIVLAAKAATQTPIHTTTTTITTTTTNHAIPPSSTSKEQVDPGLAAKLNKNLQHIFVLLDKQLKHSDSFVFTNAVGAIEALSDLNLADTVPVILNTLLDGSNTGRGSSLEKSRRLLKLVEAVVRVAVRAGAMLAQVVTPLLSVLLDFAAVGSRACSPRTHPGKLVSGLARTWGISLLQLRDEQEIRASAYAGLGELYHVLAPSCAAPHMTRFLRQTKTVLCGSVLEGPRVRRAVAMALAKVVTGLHTGRRKLQDIAEDLCAIATTLRQCADTDPDTIVVAHAAVALDVVEQIKIDFLQSTV